MAKGSFVLHGARGKVGNVVAQKGPEGGTVLREYVVPSNPRTNKQMQQRIAFGAVQTAGAAMNALVNHAFEGFPVGKKSRQRFSQLNISRLKALAAQQVADPTKVDLCAFSPKNMNVLLPNPYIISRGSLARQDFWKVFVESGELLLGIKGENTVDIELGSTGEIITWRQFINALGFQPGDEVSFITIESATGDPEDVLFGVPEWGQGVRPSVFAAGRVVFRGYNDIVSGESSWDAAIDELNLDGQSATTLLEQIVDGDKTSDWALRRLASILTLNQSSETVGGETVNTYTLTVAKATLADENSERSILAAGSILSRLENGVERRSNEDMKCINIANEGEWFGMTAANAIDSYYSASTEDSVLFLDQGGTNEIGAAQNPQ